VRFVGGADAPARDTSGLDAARRMGVAARLRTAVAVGDVTEIHALAGSLMGGSPAESALGERINRLVLEFDFAGLGELGESLAGSEQP